MGQHGTRVRTAILDEGLKLWPHVSARGIARILHIDHSSVLYHFGSVARLRYAVAAHAIERRDDRVIRYLIAEKHDVIASLPPGEQQAFWIASIPG